MVQELVLKLGDGLCRCNFIDVGMGGQSLRFAVTSRLKDAQEETSGFEGEA